MALNYFYNAGSQSYSVSYDSCTAGPVVIPSTATDGVNGVRPVTSIGRDNIIPGPFYNCTSLTSITIPNSVTGIGSQAFYGCSSLTNITIPDSITSIGESAFESCSSLTTITIPNSVRNIRSYAFANCNGLIGTLTIPNSITGLAEGVFNGCVHLTDVVIGSSVTSIGQSAFAACYDMTSVIIPQSVKTIGINAFQSTNLTSAYFLGDAPSLGGNIFTNTPDNLKIYRYSIRSGWSSTFNGKNVLLKGSLIHKGLQTFGLSNISLGKISIKKQNLGGGKLIIKPKPFDPKDLINLQLWLKADAGVILDGSNVTAWNDQSGNNRNFTKSIDNTGFPTFSNGALLFTANSTYGDPNASILALPSASLNFTTPYTLIALVRAGQNNSCVFSKSTDSYKRRKYQISVNGGVIGSLESTNEEDTGIGYNTGTGNDVDIKRLIVSQYSSNTSGLIRYNGAQVATGSVDVGIDQTNDASIFIGASPFTEGRGENQEASTEMHVYEIIFYNRALSIDEIKKIESYLNQKYSIY
jgi:hypothetical protein